MSAALLIRGRSLLVRFDASAAAVVKRHAIAARGAVHAVHAVCTVALHVLLFGLCCAAIFAVTDLVRSARRGRHVVRRVVGWRCIERAADWHERRRLMMGLVVRRWRHAGRRESRISTAACRCLDMMMVLRGVRLRVMWRGFMAAVCHCWRRRRVRRWTKVLHMRSQAHGRRIYVHVRVCGWMLW